MSAIALPFGAFDVLGRRIKQVPFAVAAITNQAQETLEANGMVMMVFCKACYAKTQHWQQSKVDGDADGHEATMTCACTKRVLRA
jgi:hypothetical protein